MKANPSNREQYKTNKIATRKEYDNEVNSFKQFRPVTAARQQRHRFSLR